MKKIILVVLCLLLGNGMLWGAGAFLPDVSVSSSCLGAPVSIVEGEENNQSHQSASIALGGGEKIREITEAEKSRSASPVPMPPETRQLFVSCPLIPESDIDLCKEAAQEWDVVGHHKISLPLPGRPLQQIFTFMPSFLAGECGAFLQFYVFREGEVGLRLYYQEIGTQKESYAFKTELGEQGLVPATLYNNDDGSVSLVVEKGDLWGRNFAVHIAYLDPLPAGYRPSPSLSQAFSQSNSSSQCRPKESGARRSRSEETLFEKSEEENKLDEQKQPVLKNHRVEEKSAVPENTEKSASAEFAEEEEVSAERKDQKLLKRKGRNSAKLAKEAGRAQKNTAAASAGKKETKKISCVTGVSERRKTREGGHDRSAQKP